MTATAERTTIGETLDTVERVEVLPFHKLGAPKYAALGIPFPLENVPTPDAEPVRLVRGQFAGCGIPVH